MRKLLWLSCTVLGLAGLLWVLGWLVRPDLSAKPRSYSRQELEQAEKLRDIRIDPDHPLVLYRKVDYSQGAAAAWYPKGESPILQDLVAQGQLPPVADRVGPEPLVFEGVEGIGRYGGTWIRMATASNDMHIMASRLSYHTLVRWSPQGYPIVPHVAKSWTVSPDGKEYVFQLRHGLKWSDGQPFTADDILYWWENEIQDKEVYGKPPEFMKVKGKVGKVEKLGLYEVKFSFPESNGMFLAKLATYAGLQVTDAPRHYLAQYNPTIGNPDLIRRTMEARSIPDRGSLYWRMKDLFNPEHPRLWPWIYRTYRTGTPQTCVRNPYYFVVDTQGNQLPYVDRMLFEIKTPRMASIIAANGDLTMQNRHLSYADYTHLMSQRQRGGYEVYHWYPGDRSDFVVQANVNRMIEPDKPATAFKAVLLADARFRQALSLAINRQAIIKAAYNGQGEPANCAPGPGSLFYEPSYYKKYTEYDPNQANRLLDDLGLAGRDFEGMRTFRDGSRMSFFIDIPGGYLDEGPGQLLVDDWTAVGVRVVLRMRNRALFEEEARAMLHDLDIYTGNGDFMPLIEPGKIIPFNNSAFAPGYCNWYYRGGLYGNPKANSPGSIAPPPGHPLIRAMEVYDQSTTMIDPLQQRDIFAEAERIAADNVWSINICTPPPTIFVVKNGFRNVPKTAVCTWAFLSPANAGIETFFFDKPNDSAGALAQMKQEILHTTAEPSALSSVEARRSEGFAVPLIKYLFLSVAVLGLGLLALRHPYIGRRLLIMVPTLVIISVISFVIIQLPPGDYINTRIMDLRMRGDEYHPQDIEDLQRMFYLNEPMPVRYAHWLGLKWFTTFDPVDKGLLQGNLGRSMEDRREVSQIVGDRIMLTVLISLGTILFTWVVAVPIGIYSAVRQYSVGDYVLTFIGFIGMCVPSFLLALLLVYASDIWLGVKVSGLFSSQYGAQPEWDWPKVIDLLKHIWVPIVVLGVSGTAGMIRVMRGNLLDELKKPYVITAMAKGVRPMKLLFKYPVRMALNPFISSIGGIFPALVSGGAIVAMVLSLPTVGPLMLDALLNEDMYLAGSMLMVLSLLGVLGTLVSDLLLLWLDPRIRFQGGSR